MTIFYEYIHNYRTIHLNRKTHLDGIDFWNGDSIGRWEGNTLVVDVANFNDQTWLDRAGNFHSDALHVVERYTRTDANTITYEATIEDPQGLYAAVEDQPAAPSSPGAELQAAGIRVSRLRRGRGQGAGPNDITDSRLAADGLGCSDRLHPWD